MKQTYADVRPEILYSLEADSWSTALTAQRDDQSVQLLPFD